MSIIGISTVQKDECEKKIGEARLAAWEKEANIDILY